MISRVRPSSPRGMKRLMVAPNGSGTGARISGARLQDVTAAADGVQKARLARVGLDLAPQPHDLVVDGAFARIIHSQSFGDLLTGQYLVRLAGERGEQRGLSAGQADQA